MAKGYWVVNNIVDDPEAYKAYQAFVGPYLLARGAKFLVRAGAQKAVEGDVLPRTMVIEFPTYAEAVAAYEAPEYREGKAMRQSLSRGNFAIVEGVEG